MTEQIREGVAVTAELTPRAVLALGFPLDPKGTSYDLDGTVLDINQAAQEACLAETGTKCPVDVDLDGNELCVSCGNCSNREFPARVASHVIDLTNGREQKISEVSFDLGPSAQPEIVVPVDHPYIIFITHPETDEKNVPIVTVESLRKIYGAHPQGAGTVAKIVNGFFRAASDENEQIKKLVIQSGLIKDLTGSLTDKFLDVRFIASVCNIDFLRSLEKDLGPKALEILEEVLRQANEIGIEQINPLAKSV